MKRDWDVTNDEYKRDETYADGKQKKKKILK